MAAVFSRDAGQGRNASSEVAAGRSAGAVAEARLFDPGGRPRTEQGDLLGFGEHRFVPETEPSTRVGYNGLVVTEDPATTAAVLPGLEKQ
jgi:hypothetical protein